MIYDIAYEISKSIKDFLNPKVIHLLQIQKYRKNLDKELLEKNLKNIKRKEIFMVGSSKYNDVFEYYLKWQSDLNTGNYRSFIIGISPLLAELQKKIIEKYYPKQKKIKLNAKWNNTEFTEEIQLVIKKLEKSWKTKGEFIMSYQFNDIIQELSQIPKDKKTC
ncbi:MAG: hypothetical protein ACTHWZ_05405 [Peptoniphilaceae bacterium]